jgi:hypothetical protein
MTPRLRASIATLVATGLTAPVAIFAQQEALGRAKNLAGGSGLNTETDAVSIIGVIINAALGILGVVMVLLIIYAGYMYLTAQGDDDRVADAKKLIRNAVIGMIIIMLSYVIAGFVISNVTKV